MATLTKHAMKAREIISNSLTKYKVEYQFSGCGYQIIKAKNEKEARDKFYEGEFKDDIDTSDNYCITQVDKI